MLELGKNPECPFALNARDTTILACPSGRKPWKRLNGIHKKTISYCVKDISGKVLSEGKIPATRQGLQEWVGTLAKPWTVAMEATMFTGWIYDYLRPHAAAVKVAHPLMLRAIAVAKKRN